MSRILTHHPLPIHKRILAHPDPGGECSRIGRKKQDVELIAWSPQGIDSAIASHKYRKGIHWGKK